jgi:TonB family protein
LAADAEAIRSGIRGSDYAKELLTLARMGHNAAPVCALGMVRASNLERRVRAVCSEAPHFTRGQVGLLGLFLASAALASSTVRLRTGGPNMRNTILSALLTSAALSAGTINGTVHDAKGTPVADADVTLTNPDTSATEQHMTGADGTFSFAGNKAGQYILRIEKAGFASVFRVFDMNADSNIGRDFTLPNEGDQSVADVVTSGSENQKKVKVGGAVAQNNLIRKVQPVYPSAAKVDHIQGAVEIDAVISKDGLPVELRVVSSPDDSLSESALEAVRQWRYRPTLLNGQPVEIETRIMVNYTLAQ